MPDPQDTVVTCQDTPTVNCQRQEKLWDTFPLLQVAQVPLWDNWVNHDGYSVAAVILSAQQLWVLSTITGLPSTYLDGMKMCRGLLLGITISVDYVVLIVTCPGSNK